MTYLPVLPFQRPPELNGVANGSVPANLLADCGLPGFKMYHLAARGMCALVDTVYEKLGIVLGASSTCRTLARQIAGFDGTNPALWSNPYDGRYVPQDKWAEYEATSRKWAVKSNGMQDVRTWKGIQWKRRAGTAGSAVPGTSNHGLCCAVDLIEYVRTTLGAGIARLFSRATGRASDAALSGKQVGVSTKLVSWLIVNAYRFGFSFEDQSETWHLRWISGDTIPADVLAWERLHATPTPPEPTPIPPEDDDMTTARIWGHPAYANRWLIGPSTIHLSPKLHASYRAEGIVEVIEAHEQTLATVLHQCGLTRADLVKV